MDCHIASGVGVMRHERAGKERAHFFIPTTDDRAGGAAGNGEQPPREGVDTLCGRFGLSRGRRGMASERTTCDGDYDDDDNDDDDAIDPPHHRRMNAEQGAVNLLAATQVGRPRFMHAHRG